MKWKFSFYEIQCNIIVSIGTKKSSHSKLVKSTRELKYLKHWWNWITRCITLGFLENESRNIGIVAIFPNFVLAVVLLYKIEWPIYFYFINLDMSNLVPHFQNYVLSHNFGNNYVTKPDFYSEIAKQSTCSSWRFLAVITGISTFSQFWSKCSELVISKGNTPLIFPPLNWS